LAPYKWLTVKISNFWKSKTAAAVILKITKIAISQPQFHRSSRNLAWWCKLGRWTASTVKKSKFRIQDGRWQPFWKKPLNHHISTTVRPILIKFVRLTPPSDDWPLKFRIFENPKWQRPPSWKSQYLSNGLTDFHEIWHGDAPSIKKFEV